MINYILYSLCKQYQKTMNKVQVHCQGQADNFLSKRSYCKTLICEIPKSYHHQYTSYEQKYNFWN